MPPVTVTWYDGGNKPPRPAGTENDPNMNNDGGSIFIGDKGMLTSGSYGNDWHLQPDSLAADFKKPTPMIPRSTGHYTDWTPLTGRPGLFSEPIDETDPWQFKNVLVHDA